MNFCSNCGTLLVFNKEKHCLICRKCKWEEKSEANKSYTRTPVEEKIIIIGRAEQHIHTLPRTRAMCSKCGHDKAYWWMIQTRSGDEGPTQFYRCEKCRYTWRDYS